MATCKVDPKPTIKRVLAGDTDAFTEIIAAYQRLVGHIVCRMVNHDLDRQDLCQDVFLKVYRNLRTFQFESKFSTWVGRIAYNTCINYLKKKRLPLYEDCSRREESIESHSVDFTSPADFSESNDLSARLEKEITKLPTVFRAILTLYHVDDMSYAEIAQIMHLPDGTVKSYLFRARKLLKERLMSKYQLEEIWH